jgi:hypothetical protein
MRLPPMAVKRPSRSPLTITVLIFSALCSALPAAAQTAGVIAFRDDCTHLLYAMRGDGSGRTALQLPPLPVPGPADQYRYWDPWVLDVTTRGPLTPLTVVYYVGIARQDSSTLEILEISPGLYAVEVSEVGGSLVSGSPRRLVLPDAVSFANVSRDGAFSLNPERLALVAPTGQTSRVFMTAAVDRDATGAITGLSDFVVLGDLSSLGQASSFIDYSSDGRSIVLSISSDLYRLHLAADYKIYGAAELLTPNTDGVAEWNPSYSPDGSRIAYTAGAIGRSGGVSTRATQISVLDLGTRASTPLTTKRNKGKAADGLNNAMWSANGLSIGFSAFTGATPRRSPCSALINAEIFRINSDGTGVASALTTTNGTGVEAWPQWGW